ncbi:uncharacterized protein [Acropora muricata]|uniref:uncharacterized protein n=1 Tax=Acropora muricata TaxID=159855 RepID=UPI0034E46104
MGINTKKLTVTKEQLATAVKSAHHFQDNGIVEKRRGSGKQEAFPVYCDMKHKVFLTRRDLLECNKTQSQCTIFLKSLLGNDSGTCPGAWPRGRGLDHGIQSNEWNCKIILERVLLHVHFK